MNFELIYASKEYKDVINNLMQFYIYDFSEYLGYHVEDNGLYKPYENLDGYWNDENRKFPYIIMKGKKYAGFILIQKDQSENDFFSIEEFFIMKKYRREGIGKAAAIKLFTLYKGNWQIHQRENNLPARGFWKNVIGEYTKGRFSERFENGRSIQNFRN